MPVQELPTPVPVEVPPGTPIEFKVEEGTLYAKPNGGAGRFYCGSDVIFESDYYFTLQFTQLGGTPRTWNPGKPSAVGNRYVLKTSAPTVGSGDDAPYYKYTATVGALQLDPIVIIDKR
jgi:hypothetical protein